MEKGQGNVALVSVGREDSHCHVCIARLNGFCGELPPHDVRALGLGREAAAGANGASAVAGRGRFAPIRFARPKNTTPQWYTERITMPPDRALRDIHGGDRGKVIFVRSGILRVQRLGRDGRRQILSLILPGEMVMDEILDRPDYTIESCGPVQLCQMDRGAFDQLLRTMPSLRRAVVAQQAAKVERLRWQTWALGTQKPEERLCGFLAFATRFMPFQANADGGGILSIEMSRQDIADLLGTTVETISRISRRLHRDGIIEIQDPSRFRLRALSELIARGAVEHLFSKRQRPIRRPLGEMAQSVFAKIQGTQQNFAARSSIVAAMTLVNAYGLEVL